VDPCPALTFPPPLCFGRTGRRVFGQARLPDFVFPARTTLSGWQAGFIPARLCHSRQNNSVGLAAQQQKQLQQSQQKKPRGLYPLSFILYPLSFIL
jgi:hypothetical protein